jgi:hypothetical protein
VERRDEVNSCAVLVFHRRVSVSGFVAALLVVVVRVIGV